MPAISVSAGWGRVFLWRRSYSAGCKDINRFPTFSENWNHSFHLKRRLSKGGRRRKVGYTRAATFNGKSGDSPNCIEYLQHGRLAAGQRRYGGDQQQERFSLAQTILVGRTRTIGKIVSLAPKVSFQRLRIVPGNSPHRAGGTRLTPTLASGILTCGGSPMLYS